MRTLHLSLKAQWYDMIESGIKKEEYREIKPFWCARLLLDGFERKWSNAYWRGYIGNFNQEASEELKQRMKDRLGFHLLFQEYDVVKFSYGYTKRTMSFAIESISIDKGNTEWGAEGEKEYFVIKLGERITDDERENK